MRVVELRSELARRLDDPHEVRVLLEEATGLDATRLVLTAEAEVAPDRVEAALAAAERRRIGEPLQHVVGHWPFRSLELTVDGRALIPRPETELVVEVALEELDRAVGGDDRLSRCLDLGTGTGAIALSIAVERPASEVIAVDASPTALELAAANLADQPAEVQRRVHLVEGSWFEALESAEDGAFDLIVSNPPYLSTAEWETIEPLVRDYDPPEALLSGPTGTEAIEAVLSGAPRYLAVGASLVVEIGWTQGSAVAELARAAGASQVEIRADLAGRDRILVARF